jgi:hypothetical protein
VWADVYQCEAAGTLTVQVDLAASIAQAIVGTIGPLAERRPATI